MSPRKAPFKWEYKKGKFHLPQRANVERCILALQSLDADLAAHLAVELTVTCDARYYSTRMGVNHYCGLAPGHDGKHRCQLCGGEWE